MESPSKHNARIETDTSTVPVPADEEVEQELDDFDDKDVKGMLKMLMMEMRKGRGAVNEASKVAKEARQTAMEAKAAVEVTRQDIEQIKIDVKEVAALKDKVITKEELPQIMKQINFDPWANAARSKGNVGTGAAGGGGLRGKATRKGERREDQKTWTLYFGNFPEETKDNVINGHIENWTAGVKESIEEIYTIGMITERGAARFKTEGGMWEFMINNRGKLQYDVMGVKVDANPDSSHDPSLAKSEGIRKVVRMIIEEGGGDGPTVKKDIVSNYGKGKVWWKGEKVAEWDEAAGTMRLLGDAVAYQTKYDKLMGHPE